MALKKLREMLDSKEISAVELTEQYLDRIEKSDKEINSYITVCKENALADAKKAQEVIDSGNSGAFTGLPISVKDNICTLGVKTTCASHMLDDFIPPYNATVMGKIKERQHRYTRQNKYGRICNGRFISNIIFRWC